MKTSRNHPDRSFLEGILSLFADVRRGEGGTALLLMLNIFVLLTAYYIIKPVREALILGSGGAEIKSYTGAAQALLFLLIVPIYGAVANRVNRLHLVNGVTAFFISNLVVFYLLAVKQTPIAIPFFIWVGLFNLMLVTQVWALANDMYRPGEGRRLFAIIGIGSSLGAIFGAYLSGLIFDSLGPYRMMLLSAALLLVCMALTTWAHRRERSRHDRQPQPVADRVIDGRGGFQLVLRHRYLLLIAIMVLLTNLVNTTGEFILGKAVKQQAEIAVSTAGPSGLTEEKYIGKFYADFFFWVNILGAALQLFVASRVLKYLGIGAALLFLPIIALGSYTLLAFVPILSYVRFAKICENGTDYSIQNTSRHALFLQVDRDAKYKAKTAIDSFFWRTGDALSAVIVFVGTQFAFTMRNFALTNIVLVVVWLALVIAIIRMRKGEETKADSLEAAA